MHSDGNTCKIRGVCFKVVYLMTIRVFLPLLNAIIFFTKILANAPLTVITRDLGFIDHLTTRQGNSGLGHQILVTTDVGYGTMVQKKKKNKFFSSFLVG